MQIALDVLSRKLKRLYANGVNAAEDDLNTPVICSDVMQACGYVTTGVAREFNVFPSYRLVKIPTKKRPIAVVNMAHAVEWLRHKHKRFRLNDNKKGKQVLGAFAEVWLAGLAKDGISIPENPMIDRPIEAQNLSDLDSCFGAISADLKTARQQLCQYNAEIAERKTQFVRRIELLKNELMELESLV